MWWERELPKVSWTSGGNVVDDRNPMNCRHGCPILSAEHAESVERLLDMAIRPGSVPQGPFDALLHLARSHWAEDRNAISLFEKAFLMAAFNELTKQQQPNSLALQCTHAGLRICAEVGCFAFFQDGGDPMQRWLGELDSLGDTKSLYAYLSKHIQCPCKFVIDFYANSCSWLDGGRSLEEVMLGTPRRGIQPIHRYREAIRELLSAAGVISGRHGERQGQRESEMGREDWALIENLKAEGNQAYRDGNDSIARTKYNMALQVMTELVASTRSDLNDREAKFQATCLANRAQCLLRQARAEDAGPAQMTLLRAAQDDCQQALSIPCVAQMSAIRGKLEARLQMARECLHSQEAAADCRTEGLLNDMHSEYEQSTCPMPRPPRVLVQEGSGGAPQNLPDLQANAPRWFRHTVASAVAGAFADPQQPETPHAQHDVEGTSPPPQAAAAATNSSAGDARGTVTCTDTSAATIAACDVQAAVGSPDVHLESESVDSAVPGMDAGTSIPEPSVEVNDLEQHGVLVGRYIRIECPQAEQDCICIEAIPNGVRVQIEESACRNVCGGRSSVFFEREFHYDHRTEGCFELREDECSFDGGAIHLILRRMPPRRMTFAGSLVPMPAQDQQANTGVDSEIPPTATVSAPPAVLTNQCLLPGTQLLDADGNLVAAENLTPGHLLRSLHANGEELSFTKVAIKATRVLPERERDVVIAHLHCGAREVGFAVTASHLLLAGLEGEGAWQALEARELRPGRHTVLVMSSSSHGLEEFDARLVNLALEHRPERRTGCVVEVELEDSSHAIFLAVGDADSSFSHNHFAAVFGSPTPPTMVAVRSHMRRSLDIYTTDEWEALERDGQDHSAPSQVHSDPLPAGVPRDRDASIYRTIIPPHDTRCAAGCRYHIAGTCRSGRLCPRCHHDDHRNQHVRRARRHNRAAHRP